jgi:hypothetical protein
MATLQVAKVYTSWERQLAHHLLSNRALMEVVRAAAL